MLQPFYLSHYKQISWILFTQLSGKLQRRIAGARKSELWKAKLIQMG